MDTTLTTPWSKLPGIEIFLSIRQGSTGSATQPNSERHRLRQPVQAKSATSLGGLKLSKVASSLQISICSNYVFIFFRWIFNVQQIWRASNMIYNNRCHRWRKNFSKSRSPWSAQRASAPSARARAWWWPPGDQHKCPKTNGVLKPMVSLGESSMISFSHLLF